MVEEEEPVKNNAHLQKVFCSLCKGKCVVHTYDIGGLQKHNIIPGTSCSAKCEQLRVHRNDWYGFSNDVQHWMVCCLMGYAKRMY